MGMQRERAGSGVKQPVTSRDRFEAMRRFHSSCHFLV